MIRVASSGPLKCIHVGRFSFDFWATPISVYQDVRCLIPERKRYGPTVTYYSWWRFQIGVRPKYRDNIHRVAATFGIDEDRLRARMLASSAEQGGRETEGK